MEFLSKYFSADFSALILSIIAMLGAIARFIHGYNKGDHEWSWRRLCAHVFVSAFSGWALGQLALVAGFGMDFVILAAGIGGWMGPNAVDFIIEIVKKKFL